MSVRECKSEFVKGDYTQILLLPFRPAPPGVESAFGDAPTPCDGLSVPVFSQVFHTKSKRKMRGGAVWRAERPVQGTTPGGRQAPASAAAHLEPTADQAPLWWPSTYKVPARDSNSRTKLYWSGPSSKT